MCKCVCMRACAWSIVCMCKCVCMRACARSMICVLTFISKPLDLSIKVKCSCHERGYLALWDDEALLHTHLTEHT